MATLDNSPGLLNKLMAFLERPEALSMGIGMLRASQPNMTHPVTFGSSLAQGLSDYSQTAEKSRAADNKERWLKLQEEIQSRKLERERRIANPKSASGAKPGKKPKQKTMTALERKKFAAFIKQYPQYANESVDDILAVADKLLK